MSSLLLRHSHFILEAVMFTMPKLQSRYPDPPSMPCSAVEESGVQRGELEAKVDAVKIEYEAAKQSWEASLRRINTALGYDGEDGVGEHDEVDVVCSRAAALTTM